MIITHAMCLFGNMSLNSGCCCLEHVYVAGLCLNQTHAAFMNTQTGGLLHYICEILGISIIL